MKLFFLILLILTGCASANREVANDPCDWPKHQLDENKYFERIEKCKNL